MTPLPRVLMVVENAPVPNDPRVWAEATTLRDYGFEVSILCPKGFSQHQESYVYLDGIHIYRYHLPEARKKIASYMKEYGISLVKTFWLSFNLFSLQGFDVVHVANPPDLFFTLGLFYRLLGKKFVFDQHDLAPELFRVKSRGRLKMLYRLHLFLERCSYRAASQVIVTNASQRRMAVERGRCFSDKVTVVWNGPNLERMRLSMSKPEMSAPAPEVKKGRPYLLAYIGVMSVQDGVEYTLYALHELVHKRHRQDVSLVLMGSGDHLLELQALAHRLGLDAYVHFTGWLHYDDMLRYLAMADVGLSPDPQNGSNEYCTMIKTLEYMALGKPIVAFDLAETRASAQGAALYATPNLVEDFADKIERLLDDEELRLSMGAIGRKRIEEELSWEHAKKHLLLAYKQLFPEVPDYVPAGNALMPSYSTT